VFTNDFGERDIQSVGDKHVPLIHNVTNTDVVAGISDADTDGLYGIASMLTAIKIAKHLELTGPA